MLLRCVALLLFSAVVLGTLPARAADGGVGEMRAACIARDPALANVSVATSLESAARTIARRPLGRALLGTLAQGGTHVIVLRSGEVTPCSRAVEGAYPYVLRAGELPPAVCAAGIGGRTYDDPVRSVAIVVLCIAPDADDGLVELTLMHELTHAKHAALDPRELGVMNSLEMFGDRDYTFEELRTYLEELRYARETPAFRDEAAFAIPNGGVVAGAAFGAWVGRHRATIAAALAAASTIAQPRDATLAAELRGLGG